MLSVISSLLNNLKTTEPINDDDSVTKNTSFTTVNTSVDYASPVEENNDLIPNGFDISVDDFIGLSCLSLEESTNLSQINIVEDDLIGLNGLFEDYHGDVWVTNENNHLETDPELETYRKWIKYGVSVFGVQNKMLSDGIPQNKIEQFVEYYSSVKLKSDNRSLIAQKVPSRPIVKEDTSHENRVKEFVADLMKNGQVNTESWNIVNFDLPLENDSKFSIKLEFPKSKPYYPYHPPTVTFNQQFLGPYQNYNILLSLYKMQITSKWPTNETFSHVDHVFETNAFPHIIDLIKSIPSEFISNTNKEMSVVYELLAKLFHTNELNLINLLPANPSFTPQISIMNEDESKANAQKGVKPTHFGGTGYSTGGIVQWTFAPSVNHKNTSYLNSLVQSIESNCSEVNVDHSILYYVIGKIIPPSITMDEFFHSYDFFDSIIESILSQPISIDCIECIQPLLSFYTKSFVNLQYTLDKKEKLLGYKLEVLMSRVGLLKNTYNNTNNSMKTEEISILKDDQVVSTPESIVLNTPSVVEIESPFESHYYMADMSKINKLPSKWYKRLRMELNTMLESLPSNVIVFSGIEVSQPNLLKVFMFPESEDCPYFGGCFEFDIFIPAEYPNVPPKVILITTGSGSVRFNPNLYNCGKVCLSLLGTWSGEPWNPQVSSLSQVINSILFLIFVEEPYFNEPGYESSKGTSYGDNQSKYYNEIIQVGTLRFGYLEHMKTTKQFSSWINPIVKDNWVRKGNEVAKKWLEISPRRASEITAVISEMNGLIEATNDEKC
eukprot:gene5535-7652_t